MERDIMTEITTTQDALKALRKVRQSRQFGDGDVTDEQLSQLLEIARWTGSARNTQPWQLLVIRDREMLGKLSRLRENIHWVEDASLAIGLISPGRAEIFEAYDEGRLTERLLFAAKLLGLGAGTAWFAENEPIARGLVNVPEGHSFRSVVAIGPYKTFKDPRPSGPKTGRKPLSELVTYEYFGNS